ncbi:hypothetical protein BV900_10380 [Agrobacterium tumefaciens]|nr:hypothetical protein BV900_10380 [Agrobacterium tumefaciens]
MAAEIMRAFGFTRLLPRQELFVVWSDPFNCVERDVCHGQVRACENRLTTPNATYSVGTGDGNADLRT